ncbi:hypothetical protein WICMUC_000234 [Wickerhamomyces mucosus]|uniref:Chloride channel protein n=1 Tax=Wickerhamomyces mucosus TaxID=1378264 RepID=A0A9P8PZQ7_9ASCO|nr:hypothetical protein WICMUC_000234 [Wickerhamomyces mucosus]
MSSNHDIQLQSLNQSQNWYDHTLPELNNFEKFKSIDWIDDNLKQNDSNIKSLNNWIKFLENYIILTIVGLTIGLTAGCLNLLTEYLSNLKLGYCNSNFLLNENHCSNEWFEFPISIYGFIIFIIYGIIFSFLASFIVLKFAPLASGSGISEIKCIVSGFQYNDFLKIKVFLMKAIGLPLAIASGLSVGKEGPSVHYAVCIGSLISQGITKLSIFKSIDHNKDSTIFAKNILISSSAAGVAVAFGSPMGGVLFSIEEISNFFKLSTMWESYYCSLIAVSTLQFLNPFDNGKIVLFEVKYDNDWNLYEIPIFIILGIFGGIYGIIISKFNIKVVNFRKKYLSSLPKLEVFILTLLTCLISYWNFFLKLDMTEGMQILFEECSSSNKGNRSTLIDLCNVKSLSNVSYNILTLLFATLIRMILTIFTYGCKIPAGIFVPSMACGATFGRLLGILIQIFQDQDTCQLNKSCINPGVYAFLGAASALSGITHLTVTVVVIMFELTGALKYILPTMISICITKLINDKYGNKYGGIADVMIEFNNFPFLTSHKHYNFEDKRVRDAMISQKIVYLPSDKSIDLKIVNKILNDFEYSSIPIINTSNNNKINGIISRLDLLKIINDPINNNQSIQCNFNKLPQNDCLNFDRVINFSPLTVGIDTPLDLVLSLFHKLSPNILLVEYNGELKGLLTRKDILRFEYFLNQYQYNSEKQEQFFENNEKYYGYLLSINENLQNWKDKIINTIIPNSRYTRLNRES